jgi:HEAT repeat protein
VALQDTVLTCLSEACKNSRPTVRLAAAQLILHCLGCIHDAALTKLVLPQLAMLATDMNEYVSNSQIVIFWLRFYHLKN